MLMLMLVELCREGASDDDEAAAEMQRAARQVQHADWPSLVAWQRAGMFCFAYHVVA